MENTIAPLSALMLDQPSYLDSLSGLVLPTESLSSKGFVTTRLSEADLEKKRRCERCNICKNPQTPSQRYDLTCPVLVKEERRRRQKPLPAKESVPSTSPISLQNKIMHEIDSLRMDQLQLKEPSKPAAVCKFHDGKAVNKVLALSSPWRCMIC